MLNNDGQDEIVMFPVPKRFLSVVIQALAQVMPPAPDPNATRSQPSAPASPSGGMRNGVDWTRHAPGDLVPTLVTLVHETHCSARTVHQALEQR